MRNILCKCKRSKNSSLFYSKYTEKGHPKIGEINQNCIGTVQFEKQSKRGFQRHEQCEYNL